MSNPVTTPHTEILCSGNGDPDLQQVNFRLPIVFSRSYDPQIDNSLLNQYNLNKDKRSRIQSLLKQYLRLVDDNFETPRPADHNTLALVHALDYLTALESDSKKIAEAFSIPDLRDYTLPELQCGLLNPMKLATGGTLRAVDLAFKSGWSINLSGGFHHAHHNHGGGFCFYNDLALGALHARNKLSTNQKVLIVDLDAHMGDGTAAILKHNNRVVLIDVYNAEIWPANQLKGIPARIDYPAPITKTVDDTTYLATVKECLSSALTAHDIGFIIFNAGADIHTADQRGQLSISTEAVLARDELVFNTAKQLSIPICILLSGAYGPEAPTLIAKSLANILGTTAEFSDLTNRLAQ